MPCAVVELPESIGDAMPQIRSAIEGCAYNEAERILAFNMDAMSVVVSANEIRIYKAQDEEDALRVVDRLGEIVGAINEG